MRRAAFVCAVLLLGALSGAVPATAVPGPEPGSSDFELHVQERVPGQLIAEYDRTFFDTALGWDFGDRLGYVCAWVEFFHAGQERFEIHYEMLTYDPPGDAFVQLSDKNGAETHPDDVVADLCGDGIGGQSMTFDGTDHFPHGTAFEFYLDGQPLVTLDYHDDECARGYWTPGDEAGEAWLWWDADGPTEHAPGMPLDCGGGPGEPVPIVRAFVQHLADGVDVCSEDSLEGDLCTQIPPGPTGPVTGPTGPTSVTGPSGGTGPAAVCYSGTLQAEDGSGRTLEARVCE